LRRPRSAALRLSAEMPRDLRSAALRLG